MEENFTKYTAQCASLPRDLREWQAYKELKQELDNNNKILPIIKELKKPSIKPRHWQKIVEITGKTLNYENPDNFFISDIINCDLLAHEDDIVDITDSADK